MKRGAIHALLILAGVFASGALVGVAGARLWSGRAGGPDPGGPNGCGGMTPDQLVELFVRRLQLDDEQREQIEPALRRGWAEVARAYEETEPAVTAVRDRTRQRIHRVLRPAQEQRYQELTAELDVTRDRKRRCRQEGIEAARRLDADREAR